MYRLRVKICGLTNEADARSALAAGADALGFNFWPGSKRYVEPNAAIEWIQRLPSIATRVVVAVDPDLEQARKWLETPGIDALQLHGGETVDFCRALQERGYRVIKAIRLRDETALGEAARFPAAMPILFDAFSPIAPGGTGETANWDLAAKFVRNVPDRRVVLAGGLSAENVTAAVQRVRPFAVDVASGVEISGQPRRKDLSRLAALFTALERANWRPKSASKGVPAGLF